MDKKISEIILPKGLLIFLRICFYFDILAVFIILSFLPFDIIMTSYSADYETYTFALFLQIIGIPSGIFCWYCIYFHFKYDKYSSSGLKLIFLNLFYAPFYFYNVIWKRKRNLKNTFKPEPVLGNTIKLQSYDE
jgi:hypothetical protein